MSNDAETPSTPSHGAGAAAGMEQPGTTSPVARRGLPLPHGAPSWKNWAFWSLICFGLLLLVAVVVALSQSAGLMGGSRGNGDAGDDSSYLATYEATANSDVFDAEFDNHNGDAMMPMERDDAGEPHSEEATPAVQQRHIIRRAEITLRVEEYDPAFTELSRITDETGGYISNARTRHEAEKTSHADITLRIPTAHFNSTLAALRNLGEVRSESISSDDITMRYVDTQARIRNAQRLESRLVEMLDSHGGTLADLMRVEREVANVRERIERKQAQIRVWDQLTSLTTIKVTLSVVSPYQPEHKVEEPEEERPSFGGKVSETWSGSLDVLSAIGEAIALSFVAIIPWLPIAALGLVSYGIFRRRHRRRDQTQPPSEGNPAAS